MAESTEFPWLSYLSEDAQREFFEELGQALEEAQMRTVPGVLVSPETYVQVLEPLLASWKATAEVCSDPELYEALTSPVRPEDLVEAPRPMAPVGEPQTKPARRCGASLPHEDSDDGWYWCDKEAGHSGAHNEGPDPVIEWTDGEIVEVYTVDDVCAVPHHVHDFVGDQDTCVGDTDCQLTYGEFRHQKEKWGSTWQGFSADLVIEDEIQQIPQQREGNDG